MEARVRINDTEVKVRITPQDAFKVGTAVHGGGKAVIPSKKGQENKGKLVYKRKAIYGERA